jgi:outer membrane protein OmpA-like peptidoglycan-associated protein
MAKPTAKKGKGLGTTGVVLIGVGVLLLGFGTYWYLRKRKIAKMKKECEEKGGIWDEKTMSCTLPDNKTQRVLKDAYDNLTFESGKAIIKPTSFPYLDELVTVIQDPDALSWTLSIEGHTDNVGGKEYNQTLSENRANSVKKYLVDKGVKAERVTAKGFGLDKPIDTNDTPEGRSKNRRVEFLITKPTVQATTASTVTTPTTTTTTETPKSNFGGMTIKTNRKVEVA